MSKNLIHKMFGDDESDEDQQPIKPTNEDKRKPENRIDNIDWINIGKKDFYDKITQSSHKNMVLRDMNEIIGDEMVVKSKIAKKKFLLTKNLNYEKQKKPKSKNYMSKRLIKKKEVFDLKTEPMSYTDLLPITKKWEDYILDMIKHDKTDLETLLKICKADFHGASITVKKSAVDSQTGVEGIVLKDSKNAFTIVNTKNKVIIILKQNCLFSFKLANKTVNVYGPCLINRVEERNKQKFTFDRVFKDVDHLINIF